MTHLQLGKNATGTIEPSLEQKPEIIQDIKKRILDGEFYVQTNKKIPSKCIDGRSPAEGCKDYAPNAAGGTLSILLADRLTMQRFHEADNDLLQDFSLGCNLLKKTYAETAMGEIGGHTDCGACGNCQKIIDYIAHRGDALRPIAELVPGFEVTAERHDLIVARAQQVLRGQAIPAGDQIIETLRANTNDGSIEQLAGQHKEVLIVINTKAGATLDRDQIQASYGDNYTLFNVDVWSFEAAARATSPEADADEIAAKKLAMLYHNLATGLVLCGPNMEVIIC